MTDALEVSFIGSDKAEPGQLKSLGTDAFVEFGFIPVFMNLAYTELINDKSVRSRQKKFSF